MHARKKVSRLLVLLLVGGLLCGNLVGCAQPSPTPSAPEPTAEAPEPTAEAPEPTAEAPEATPVPPTPTEEPPAESELIIGWMASPAMLDPQESTTGIDFGVYENIYERLVHRDETDEIGPRLATSWEQIDDTTWEFKLREGVDFSNGEPFNGDTVKCTLEHLKDTHLASYFEIVSEVEVVDEYTVRLLTSKPDPLMIQRLSGYGGSMIPCSYLDEVGREEFAIEPVGTGPYELESWVRDGDLVLVRNEDYWGEPGPYDRVIFRPIPEASSRLAALETDEIDVMTMASPDQIPQIEESGNVVRSVAVASSPFYGICSQSCSEPILLNQEFRQALNLAVDRQGLVDQLYGGKFKVVNGFTISTDFSYDPTMPPMEYDPERARELIEESGYQGETIVVQGTNSSFILYDKQLNEAVAAMLEQVGITVDLQLMELAALDEYTLADSHPGLYFGAASSPMRDPTSHWFRHLRPGGFYDTGWSSSGSDTAEFMMDTMLAAEAEMDPEQRAAMYQSVNKTLIEDPPWVLLFQMGLIYGVDPDLADWQPRPDERVLIEEFAPPR